MKDFFWFPPTVVWVEPCDCDELAVAGIYPTALLRRRGSNPNAWRDRPAVKNQLPELAARDDGSHSAERYVGAVKMIEPGLAFEYLVERFDVEGVFDPERPDSPALEAPEPIHFLAIGFWKARVRE